MLRHSIKHKPRKLKGVLIGPGSGPKERIKQLQIWVTQLVRDERIEGREDKMRETRDYAEQLLNLAIANGDRHKPTMEMADKWLLEKDLLHKLFKVLAPRYDQYSSAFTTLHRLPATYPGSGRSRAVLELKGNPYPPVIPHQRDTKNILSNVLIAAATREYFQQKHGTKEESVDSGSLDQYAVLDSDVDKVEQTLSGTSISDAESTSEDIVEKRTEEKPQTS